MKGGIAALGDTFEAGTVFVLSLWDDYEVNMLSLNFNNLTTSDTTYLVSLVAEQL